MDRFFQSVESEISEMKGTVKGSIPKWVSGSLYRNGPMLYKIGDSDIEHYFDGMAGLQRWKINDGEVTYQRKLVQSETLKKSLDANRLVITQFGTSAYPDPCKNIFQRFFSFFAKDITDNTSVTVWPQRDRVFVSTETETIHEIDPETLETTGSVRLPDYLTINTATAHTHWDPDGTVHGFGFFYIGKDVKYSLFSIPPLSDSKEAFSNLKVVGSIPARWPLHPGYLHSFSITDNYYIFPEQTAALSVPVLATMKLTGKTPADALQFYPNEKTIFHLMDRKTGNKVNPHIVYYTDAQLTFHHINAYEEDGFIIMDIICYENLEFIKMLYMKNLQSFGDPSELHKKFGCLTTVRRFVFPLHINQNAPLDGNLVTLPGCKAKAINKGKNKIYCQYEVLFDKEGGFELPQINYPKYNGKKYKYTYGIGGFLGSLTKINIETKESIDWKEEGTFVSEPIFQPNPESQEEDDGVVLAAVSCIVDNKKPFLLVLDGKTFKEIARVEFETERFSGNIHGFFRPA